MRLLSSADFFQNNIFKKFFHKHNQGQMVWIQISTEIMSVLIWVQTVCKGYQQMKKTDRYTKERVNIILGLFVRKPDFVACKKPRADNPVHSQSLITFVRLSLKGIRV